MFAVFLLSLEFSKKMCVFIFVFFIGFYFFIEILLVSNLYFIVYSISLEFEIYGLLYSGNRAIGPSNYLTPFLFPLEGRISEALMDPYFFITYVSTIM